MNSSKASSASSFDAQDYYKQLTSCLAAKNKLKVNVNTIPGYQHHLNNRTANRKPLITRQRIQAEFLAKCNARTLAAQQAKQDASSGSSKDGSRQSTEKKAKPALDFVVKGNMGRKKQEDFINLPDSFFGKNFKPEEIPGFPNFKVPKAPAQRKEAPPVHDISIPEQAPMANQSYASIATVTSAQFKPRLGSTSTPLDVPRAIISDPSDLGNYFSNPKPILTAPVRTFRDKAKSVFEAFGRVAEKIDTICLSKYSDPLTDIRGRLREIYSESCRQPRLINETLMTVSSAAEAQKVKLPPPPSTYVRPVPIFYESQEKKSEDDAKTPERSLGETAKLFNSTCKPVNMQKHVETPPLNDDKEIWDFTFDETPHQSRAALMQQFPDSEWSSVVGESSFLPESPMSETEMLFGPEPKEMEVDDDFFSTTDQSFDFFSGSGNRRTTASPSELDNTFALFTSPPKPGQRHSQRSQRERDEGRRSRHSQFEMKESPPKQFSFLPPSPPRRREPSQRSQREDSRRSQLHDANIKLDDYQRRDSSMSTYRWTPHIGNTSIQTQSSRSQHYPFERRNIFKNSFNFN